jgi:hypothetical protein
MPKPRVYVETTIVSYLAARQSRDVVTAGRQVTTQQWWDNERHKYELMASSEVADECGGGDPFIAARRQTILNELSIFPVDGEIMELAERLIAPGAIPRTAGPDAIHIAAACVGRCGFLVTWNFRHIANVTIRRKVEGILLKYGYSQTIICTPDQLR